MKKITSIFMLFVMLFVFTACSDNTDIQNSNNNTNQLVSEGDDKKVTSLTQSQEETPSQIDVITIPVLSSATEVKEVSISELIINPEIISLTAQENSDGTLTYTYIDTSIKQLYSSDDTTRYLMAIYALNESNNPLTVTSISTYSIPEDEKYILDFSMMVGYDSIIEDNPEVVVNSDGISITWISGFIGGSINEINSFLVEINFDIGNERVSEQIRFERDILK